MNQPFAAVMSFLDDGITDSRLEEWYKARVTVFGKGLASATMMTWFREHDGYNVRFPRIYNTVVADHNAHVKAMDDFDAFIHSIQSK